MNPEITLVITELDYEREQRQEDKTCSLRHLFMHFLERTHNNLTILNTFLTTCH